MLSQKERGPSLGEAAPVYGFGQLLPQTLCGLVVDVGVYVRGVNDLNTGVDEGVNRLALEALDGCFYCRKRQKNWIISIRQMFLLPVMILFSSGLSVWYSLLWSRLIRFRSIMY